MSRFAVSNYPPGFAPVVAHVIEGADGGVATFVRHLVRSQAADATFGPTHLVLDQNTRDAGVRGLPVHQHEYRSSRSPLAAPGVVARICQVLQDIRPDLVVLHSSFPGLWGRLAPRRPWKTVYCPHGWAFLQNVSWPARLLRAGVEVGLATRTDVTVSVSRDEYRRARRVAWHGAHRMIYPGVEPLPPDPAPGYTLTGRNFAFVGRFESQKGLDRLFAIFRDSLLADTTLWLIGGDIRGTGDVQVPNQPNVRPLGWMNVAQLAATLRQMDALIVPSHFEAFGLVALEAMRAGLAVIAHPVGGLREIVEDGKTGMLVDCTDARASARLLHGLSDEGLRRMGEAALARYENRFHWELCYTRWRALMLDAAARPA